MAQAAVVGPESRTSAAPVQPETSFVGIQLAEGTSLRMTESASLVDRDIHLPDTTPRSFWLNGRRWQTPDADDAESMLRRYVGRSAGQLRAADGGAIALDVAQYTTS